MTHTVFLSLPSTPVLIALTTLPCRFSLKILLIFVDIYYWNRDRPISMCIPLRPAGFTHTRCGGCVTEHTRIIIYYYNFLEFQAKLL
jgi:hypothetical protein